VELSETLVWLTANQTTTTKKKTKRKKVAMMDGFCHHDRWIVKTASKGAVPPPPQS
jgi:hypothetical protein